MMGKVFVFLADGFEEIEGLTVVDMLRRAEIPTVTVSIGSSRNIIGAHRIEVEADIMFHEVLEAEGDVYKRQDNIFRDEINTSSFIEYIPSLKEIIA